MLASLTWRSPRISGVCTLAHFCCALIHLRLCSALSAQEEQVINCALLPELDGGAQTHESLSWRLSSQILHLWLASFSCCRAQQPMLVHMRAPQEVCILLCRATSHCCQLQALSRGMASCRPTAEQASAPPTSTIRAQTPTAPSGRRLAEPACTPCSVQPARLSGSMQPASGSRSAPCRSGPAPAAPPPASGGSAQNAIAQA